MPGYVYSQPGAPVLSQQVFLYKLQVVIVVVVVVDDDDDKLIIKMRIIVT